MRGWTLRRTHTQYIRTCSRNSFYVHALNQVGTRTCTSQASAGSKKFHTQMQQSSPTEMTCQRVGFGQRRCRGAAGRGSQPIRNRIRAERERQRHRRDTDTKREMLKRGIEGKRRGDRGTERWADDGAQRASARDREPALGPASRPGSTSPH